MKHTRINVTPVILSTITTLTDAQKARLNSIIEDALRGPQLEDMPEDVLDEMKASIHSYRLIQEQNEGKRDQVFYSDLAEWDSVTLDDIEESGISLGDIYADAEDIREAERIQVNNYTNRITAAILDEISGATYMETRKQNIKEYGAGVYLEYNGDYIHRDTNMTAGTAGEPGDIGEAAEAIRETARVYMEEYNDAINARREWMEYSEQDEDEEDREDAEEYMRRKAEQIQEDLFITSDILWAVYMERDFQVYSRRAQQAA